MNKNKFIFITGGVVSSLGKGLVASSVGALLQAYGFTIHIRKLDPYLNIDAGTMSPAQHGEVFVTSDGAETDLDLGNYERFTGIQTKQQDHVTAGKVYRTLLNKERSGAYLGQTVQMIPHVTSLIQSFILEGIEGLDFLICEIGGTVGDIESQPFLEAIRQINYQLGRQRVIFIHLTFVPYLTAAQEWKTKPTQHSVRELNAAGIQPHIVLCRSERKVPLYQREKIANLCNISLPNVIAAPDVGHIYELPIVYNQCGLDLQILNHFNINKPKPCLTAWKEIRHAIQNPVEEVTLTIAGKYTEFPDAYKSLVEALNHGAIYNKIKVHINWVNVRLLNSTYVEEQLKDSHAILVPGGFGDHGIKGKMLTIHYARVHNIPFLGICLGMQLAAVEFARHVVKLDDAHSEEFYTCRHSIVKLADSPNMDLGGTMRLGVHSCAVRAGSKIAHIYQSTAIRERYRNRYIVDVHYQDYLEKNSMLCSGISEDGLSVAAIELKAHPWFIGVQFHPEFQSGPFSPHPIFISFIHAAVHRKSGQYLPSYLSTSY